MANMMNHNGHHYLETMVAISLMLIDGRIKIHMAVVTRIETAIDHKRGQIHIGMATEHKNVDHAPHIHQLVMGIQGDLTGMADNIHENHHHHR
jgi:hypothetical protein